MGATKRKGWMKRERAKFPINSKVICVEDRVWYSGCEGIVVDYGIARQTPTLHIQITSVPENHYEKNYHANIGDIATGQPVRWYELIER